MIDLIRKLLFKFLPVTKKIERHPLDVDVLLSSEDLYPSTMVRHPHHLFDVRIGAYSYVDRNATISNTRIGKFCSIGPNLLCGWGIHPTNGISTSPMFYSTKCQNGTSLSQEDKIIERKPVSIGNDVYIGANVTILDGVTIGDGAIIGAGAVVSKDIPPFAVAVGCPIEIKKFRMTSAQIEAMQRIRWWDWEDSKLKDVERLFFDIDGFVKKYDSQE